MTEPLKLLTEKEVCALLGCCRETLRRERLRKRIRPTRVGRNLRFTRAEVQRYIDRSTKAG